MHEYQNHLDFYKIYWFKGFTYLLPRSEWGDEEAASRYLEKYWLLEAEYESVWQPIARQVFTDANGLPGMVFQPHLLLNVQMGGCLFLKSDFQALRSAALAAGDRYILVTQLPGKERADEPMFRMKYPADISWEELVSGNYISAVLTEMPSHEYYVFGDTGTWGKYAASEADHPVDILGYAPHFKTVFDASFPRSSEEDDQRVASLPPAYQARLME